MTPPLRCATWNVERDHPVATVVATILRVFHRLELDVLHLQELGDYAHELATQARELGFRLVWFHDVPGASGQGILVAQPELVRAAWRMSGAGGGWFTSTGHTHAPTFPIAVNYAGVVFVSVHAPVSVNWPGGIPVGPPRRVAAYLQHSRRLRRAFRAHPRMVQSGDWNASPSEHGPGSPRSLALRAGAELYPPGESTGHGPIDYPIARGVEVHDIHVAGHHGSDHRLVAYWVRPHS